MGADIIDEEEIPERFSDYYNGCHYAGGVIIGDDPEISAVNKVHAHIAQQKELINT